MSIHTQLPTNTRPLRDGERVKLGDYVRIADTFHKLTGPCKYDPGCCIGHQVEAHEQFRFYRETGGNKCT